MIRRVAVKRFRAFESDEFDLEPGTTFLVAPNGGGKTSLMRAVSWALFGEQADLDPKLCVRGDGPAEVTVELQLADDVAGVITRTQPKRGAATLQALIGDVTTSDDTELASLLSQHWRASPGHLARICFMEEHSVARRSQLTPGLDRHLHSIFGLDRLHEDLERARKTRRAAEREVRERKKAAERPEAERREDTERLVTVRNELGAAERRREEIQEQHRQRQADKELRARWVAHEDNQRQRRTVLEQLAARLSPLAGSAVGADYGTLRQVASEVESDLQRTIDEQQRAIGILEGKLDAAAVALDELTSADADCPVCLRPLGQDDREHALAGHAERRERLETEVAALRADTATHTALETVRQIQRELTNVPDVPPPPGPRPSEAADAPDDALEDQLQRVTSEIVELRETAATLERQLADDAAVLEEQRRVKLAFHRLAVAQVAEEAFEKTIKVVEREQIAPLSAAMRDGWKSLMGGRSDLAWGPGRATLVVGPNEVEYSELSGGERTIMTVMTQLLAIAASTEAQFLWLDEPLEHLDPDHRRLVAAALAGAVDDGTLRQIVVTTYEEPLVRRLRDASPRSVHVRYLAPSEDTEI